jgi:hypothetical protein
MSGTSRDGQGLRVAPRCRSWQPLHGIYLHPSRASTAESRSESLHSGRCAGAIGRRRLWQRPRVSAGKFFAIKPLTMLPGHCSGRCEPTQGPRLELSIVASPELRRFFEKRKSLQLAISVGASEVRS